MSDGVWRWNSNHAWHYCSSMFYEAHLIAAAQNEFIRYHHVRSCVYFGVSTVEAFLNQSMRQHMKEAGADEEAIFKKLRRTSLDEKRRDWPAELCGRPVTFDPATEQVFNYNKGIRDEVTHPKRRDQSIYPQLDSFNARSFTEAVALTLVGVYEGLAKPFPYWVLGWNFVGLNGDAAWPMETANLNSFYPSLRTMGFKLGHYDVNWDHNNMVTAVDYMRLVAALNTYPDDIEPYTPRFPSKPRLTRRWWDHAFIRQTVQEGEAAYAARGGSLDDQFGPRFKTSR